MPRPAHRQRLAVVLMAALALLCGLIPPAQTNNGVTRTWRQN